MGSITDENPREITLDFDFLEAGKTYRAKIYKDGPKAHYKNNPLDISMEETEISKNTKMAFKLAAGGGLAISLTELTN